MLRELPHSVTESLTSDNAAKKIILKTLSFDDQVSKNFTPTSVRLLLYL